MLRRFDKCLDTGDKAEVVKAQADEATALGLQGTPTFFINGRYISGALSYEHLRAVILEELSAGRRACSGTIRSTLRRRSNNDAFTPNKRELACIRPERAATHAVSPSCRAIREDSATGRLRGARSGALPILPGLLPDAVRLRGGTYIRTAVAPQPIALPWVASPRRRSTQGKGMT